MPAKPNPEVDRLKRELYHAQVALDGLHGVIRDGDRVRQDQKRRILEQLQRKDEQIRLLRKEVSNLNEDKLERDILVDFLVHKVNVLERKNHNLMEKNIELRYAAGYRGPDGGREVPNDEDYPSSD